MYSSTCVIKSHNLEKKNSYFNFLKNNSFNYAIITKNWQITIQIELICLIYPVFYSELD